MRAPIFDVRNATDHFDVIGRLYAIGELTASQRRPTRPVTPSNPSPDLESNTWPPTYVTAAEIEVAFELAPASSSRAISQLDLFGAAA